ncbi:MAG TPA: hypothetical protein VJA94_23770 [Candidatus Angelobacter sp.]
MATEEQLSNQLTAPVPSGENPSIPNRDASSFPGVLNAELDQIEISRRYRQVSEPVAPRAADDQSFARADGSNLAGLAFSGGGIRSATFNLGILQGLAEAKILRRFDYLSTVSGGGYIGGWFAGCVKRLQTHGNHRPKVEKVLLPAEGPASTSNEPAAVTFLRDYSNYLTPRVGLFAGDTWAFISTYVRNLFLNLLILVSALTSVLLLPYIMDFITRYIRWKLVDDQRHRWIYNWMLNEGDPALVWLAIVSLIIAVTVIIRNVTALNGPRESFARFSSEKGIQLTIVLPLFLSAWFYSVWIYAFSSRNHHAYVVFAAEHPYQNAVFWIRHVIEVGVGVWAFGSVLTWGASDEDTSLKRLAPTLLWQFVAVIASSITTGLLLWRLEALAMYFIRPGTAHPTWFIVGWLPPLLIGVIVVFFFIQIGVTGRRTSEEAREWFSRLCGYLIVNLLAWAALFLLASPMLADGIHGLVKDLSGIFVWLGSTSAGLLLVRKKDSDNGNGGNPLRKLIAAVAPYLFVIGLLVLLAKLINTIHWRISNQWHPSQWDIVVCLACALLSVLLSSRVDVNLFSMHALYGNRLVRCYLGASHSNRRPQPFTGFDPDDNLSLAGLAPSAGYEGPYPIVNTALNLVHGKELSWQQRKAESFIFTPLFCGFNAQHTGHTAENSRLSPQAYRPTLQYGYSGGGPYLGTAISISGAAASPNMGYHSSPAMGVLLTVFNVRLGWWMGNPRDEDTWRLSAPRLGLIYLFNELLGRTDDTSGFVYLSDGGHFENLGLYELVRRRCRLIMVCDASQDGEFHFEDLAGAIEKCRTDFSVEIDLGCVEEIRPAKDSIYSNSHYAFGAIRYDANHTGVIIYVKASLTGKESVELASYQRAHPAYPHESTADQWFTELQFESYRQLGHCIAKRLAQDNHFIEALSGVEAVSARALEQSAGA